MRFLQVLPKRKWQKFCAECARKKKFYVINKGWCKSATPLITVFKGNKRNVLIKKQKKIKKVLAKSEKLWYDSKVAWSDREKQESTVRYKSHGSRGVQKSFLENKKSCWQETTRYVNITKLSQTTTAGRQRSKASS